MNKQVIAYKRRVLKVLRDQHTLYMGIMDSEVLYGSVESVVEERSKAEATIECIKLIKRLR